MYGTQIWASYKKFQHFSNQFNSYIIILIYLIVYKIIFRSLFS